MHKSAEVVSVLNRLTQEMEPKIADQLIRKQTMVVAIGDELGLSVGQLTFWRASVLLDGKRDWHNHMFRKWFGAMPEKSENFESAMLIAEVWNSAWERNESRLTESVKCDLQEKVDSHYLEAFERAASKIHPIRPIAR